MQTAGDTSGIVRTDHADAPGVVTLRINRPHVKNALGPADLQALDRHLLDCQLDPEVAAVIVTGTGDAFCAGADLKQMNARSPQDRARGGETATDLMTRIVTMPKIVIAALNGASAGLGNHIALCSDLCIAKEGAALHFTGAIKGIPSMQMGALVLPMVMGLKRAKSLLLRGGRVPAERAVELGICNEVVEAGRWDAALAALAAEFSGRHAPTLAHNKFQLNQFAYQMIGALKLSSLAGAMHFAASGELQTGRVEYGAQA
ncbi:enoyl-CoA hydratase-related protein [Pigmentiphaga soli]|uniref:Enoyl-CoA hydratase-related protein n=1 Tax=Pigmentiphaga soli TaxID=1007095 RepID=A0ABP8HET1_9BURK